MKFFHISDLHLGIKLRGRSLIEDQRHILKQIVERAAEENIDAIVIVGDIYDRSVPPAEAVELFDGFITDLLSNVDNICIMVISGNHDSQERLNIFRNILQKDNVYMIGMPPSGPDDYIEKVTFNYNEGIYNDSSWISNEALEWIFPNMAYVFRDGIMLKNVEILSN